MICIAALAIATCMLSPALTSAAAQASARGDTLIVQHDGPEVRVLQRGDSLTIRMHVETGDAEPVTIGHGSRLFVLIARVLPDVDPDPPGTISFAPWDSWNAVTELEFPNPRAVWTTGLAIVRVSPGDRYGETTYRVRPPVGRYTVSICANLKAERVCSRRRIRLDVVE
jgi:hypothetical protein